MKRLAFVIGGVALFAWGMSGALTACGGDDGAVATDNDAGNTSSSGGSSGAASSSGGSSGTPSGDGGGDAGGDAAGDGGGDGGDAGGPSNPGKVSCGATECTTDTQICCRFFDGGTACNNGNNCPGGGTVELECDEKADCQGGDVCCRGIQGDQECKNDCGNLEIAVCKTNTECPDAGTCKQWTCPGNLTVRSCTMPFQGCN